VKRGATRQARPVAMRVMERILMIVWEVGEREFGEGDLGVGGDMMCAETGG
jgi:hypothetical protein